MKKYSLLISVILFSVCLKAQGKFERKIIIENNRFYCVEIVGQTGILWIGKIDEPLDSAKQFALPAGTKRRSQNFLPFAWDVHGETIYAVNYTEFAQNERLTSLKSIAINTLEKYAPAEQKTQLMEGAFNNSKIENWPLVLMLKKYQFIDDLYFDILVTDSVFYQFISVNNELTIWTYKNNVWAKSEIIPFETSGYFNAFQLEDEIYMMNDRGVRFIYKDQLVTHVSKMFDMNKTVMLDNRDKKQIQYVNQDAFTNTSQTMKLIIEHHLIAQ